MNKEIVENEKKSKKMTMLLYVVPFACAVIIAIIYILTQLKFLLIIFAILVFITLFGWDGSTRTCPECRKWNAIVWTKVEKETKESTKEARGKKRKILKEKLQKWKASANTVKMWPTERKKTILNYNFRCNVNLFCYVFCNFF